MNDHSISIMGNNGSGKSTFINYLVGLYNSEDHHPFLKDFSQSMSVLKNGSFGYAPEVAIFDNNLSAHDLIKYVANMRKVTNFDSQKILERLGLEISPHRILQEYSKGMRQRLSLALADIGSPEWLILDEPTSGLDFNGEFIVKNFIDEVKKRSKLIVATHSIRLAFELNHEIWLFKSGKIIKKIYVNSIDELEKEILILKN